MAWTAEKVRALRESTPSETAKKDEESGKWTAERVRALRTSTPSQPADAAALRAQKQTEAANADLTSKAFDEYRANNNLGFADEADRQSDWLRGEPSQALRASSSEGRAIGRTAQLDEQSPTRRESAGFAERPGSRVEALSAAAKYGVPMSTNVLEQVGSGAAAYGDGLAQKLKASYAPYSQKDEFDRLNEWFDTDDNRNLADAVRRVDNTHGAYTDADLIRNGGWTQAQIDEARQKNAAYDALPAWKKTARRAGNTIGGIADSVAGGAVMTGETAVQSAKNIADTQKNWAKVQQEIKGDARAERLFQLLTDVDMDYNPVYPESRNRDLVLMGYGSEEIRNMRDRLAGLEANDSVDPETSVGYQLYKRGQDLTGAAQSGLSDGSRAVQGAVSSAAENLAVSAINPAAVLPVLSLQGAGDAMGQSMEKGESAGKTLAGGALKFGAGWAINSVGAADLAKTMGSDYAKDTVAGQIADWVRGMAGSSDFAQQYPAIANAVTGGMDNAMQAFVETYADTAIDAALGDADAAKDLFTKEHLLNALESGLSGGASGALGGAVGTALARYNDGDASWRGNAEYYDQLDRYEKAGAAEKARQQRVEEPETALSALRPADTGASRSSPEVGALLQGSSAGEGALDGRADSATEGSGIKYSIRTDDDGKQYVQIDDDLLGNVPEENWKNTVRDAIRDLYPNGFERDGQTISNTREGRGEFTHSKYTRGLERVSSDTYADKMRMASNLDEVVSTSGPVENEQANHKNAESFNRGNINIRIGTKDYNADVLTAIKQDGREVFYDVVNIQPTTIKAPTETAEAKASGNRSMGADEISRRTDAESAASDGRGQPGISKTSIAPESMGVNGRGVENAGETVETPSVTFGDSSLREGALEERAGTAAEGSEYADLDLKVDPAGLDAADWNRSEQKAAARELVDRAQMSTKAAQAVVDAMPMGIGATVYTQAANSLYRMGVAQDVKTFEQALELTGSGSLGGATGQVMALGEVGENALRIAYTYGKGEAEAYNARKVREISSGGGVVNQDAGAYYVGDTVRSGQSADDAFIELGAKSSGTAVHRMMEGLKSGAKGFLQTAAGRIYLAGEAGSETMMHETFHALNEWSPETGQAVMDRLLKYLVEANGMESTEKLVQSYLDKYAASGQKVTYNQALEEVTADAMETVFGDAESFRNFVSQQAAEARMNAQARGAIGKVMEKIENLLQTVLRDVEHFLKKEPTNAAAKAARSLTEEQLRDLRELYFEHQAEAGIKYREALAENKTAPSEAKEAAVKYSINPDYAQDIESWNQEGRDEQEVFVLGSTGDTLQGLGARENDIYMRGSKITLILEQHPEMTLDEIKRIPEILDDPVMVLTSQNKGRAGSQNTRLVMFGNVKAKDGRPILCVLDLQPVEKGIAIQDMQKVTSSYTKDNNPVGFVRNSDVLYVSENKKRTTTLLRTLGFQMPSELQRYGSIGSISYLGQNVKLDGVPFAELETADTKRTAAWLGSTGLQLPVPPTMYGSMGRLTYFEDSVKMMEPGSRNAKLAEFLTRDADGKYQLDVDADAADAAKTGLGNVAEQTETIRNAVEAGGNKRVSDEGLENIAKAVKSDTKSRIDGKTLTERLRGLSEYLAGAKNVNWDDAHAFMLDIAEQIMLKSSSKNDTLWKQHPELHEMGMKVEKGSTAFQELVYRYGSWANAKRELGRHGVKITQLPEGQHSRWDADFRELQQLGAGLFPDEVPNSAADALEAMANAHDAIKPVMENAFDEDWEGAKQDIALQIWQRYLASPELANAESAKLREELNQQWTEMRQQAKQEALEARAKAIIEAAKKEKKIRDNILEPFRNETAKANDRRNKAEEFAKKQRESVELRVQLEKNKRMQQVQKVRDARENDNTRRVVRNLTSKLTQMCEKPTAKSNAPEYLLDKLRPVVMLANDAIGNHEAAQKIAEGTKSFDPIPEGVKIQNAVEGLSKSIEREMKMSERSAAEWQQSKLDERISDWLEDVNENRQIEMEKLRDEIENANKWLVEETPEKKAYLDRLNADLKAYQDGNLATLTTEQLRGLREILEQTMTIIEHENVMLGSMEDVMIDDFAEGMAGELTDTAKKQKDGLFWKIGRELISSYKLNTMNIERNFERLGGYSHGGYMEQLGQMLNKGQFKKERIKAEGERIFEHLTGPKHEKELFHFTHDKVDIGLKTQAGKPWLVTHDIMAELWVQLQNKQGLHHLLYGGATIADVNLSTMGFNGLAEQYSETVTLGELVTTDKEGNKLNAYEISQQEDTLRTSLIAEIEKNLTDYDNQWIAAFRELGVLTKRYINEASMTLYHVKLARVNNYIRLHVDKNTLVEQNTGIQYNNSVGNEGYMKSRQNSSKPLELVGLVRQASESIENAAQFGGMAIPLRNAEKVLNTMEGGKTLYGQIERVWGRAGRSYMTKAMADLTGSKGQSEVFDRLSGKLRSAAAAAVLTGNLNVTLLQAASLPTAVAELGWGSTGHATIQFVMNLNPAELDAIVDRAYRFGDTLLPTRLRGSSRGELSNAAKETGFFGTLHDSARNSSNVVLQSGVRAVDAVGDFAGGWIGWMDKVTVASLFHGAENYVQKNPAVYELTKADLPTKAQEDGSEAYQKAVTKKFQRIVERTQPNYTAMQRTGLQRSKNQLAKTLMMFSTQRQQNAQIMVSAVEDVAAQWSRNAQAKKAYQNEQNEQNKDAAQKAKTELDKAGKRLGDAISSQIVQTAIIAGLGMGVKFFLHRWDDLQDENGDMTLSSLLGSFLYQFFNSGVSNYTGGSEIWTAAETIHNKKLFGNYDSISMTGFSAINDAVTSMTKLNTLLDKDTSEMTDEELEAYHNTVKWAWADTAGQLMMLRGVPYNNGKKYVQGVFGWMDTVKQWKETGERNFNSTPSSATGQYDRLYDAIQNGDAEEVQGATKKLAQMLKEGKIKEDKTESQLGSRLKKYDPDILAAAEAQNAGKPEDRKDAKQEVFDRLCTAYGVKKQGEKGETNEDKARRTWFIALIDKAVKEKADELLAGDKDRNVYDDLTDALETGRAKDVQSEVDRLLTAGKKADAIQTKITGVVKSEYLAGNSHDREKLAAMLLQLEADGKPLYEEKNFESWVKQDQKKQEAAAGAVDEWAGVR